ncbi:MAG: hypothetical protein PHU25_16020 [Deltaproteobacteria bacterium]|nr:hypothetical protein [Deltaproteobacteria bacterium]
MKQIASRPFVSLFSAMLLVALLCPTLARAQAANVQALGLVRQAMEAYSNLNLDQARAQLDQALALAPQLDKPTLARIHASYGIVWIGGFTDNAKGQQSFLVGLCLDNTILVDPLLSTPEIDMMFSLSKQQVNPATCQTALAGVVTPGPVTPAPVGGVPGMVPQPAEQPAAPPVEPSCGTHNAPEEQKQKTELPIYVELDSSMIGRVTRLTAKYAFDANQKYTDLPLSMVGNGYGAMISCEQGKIHEFDPKTIAYYVEGYDSQNHRLCTIGTKEMPNEVRMMPEVAIPVEGLPGMPPPKECKPCPPWDETCKKGAALPGIDEPCTKSQGCQEELVCGESGLCESSPESAKTGGPSAFYINPSFGAGFGYMTKDKPLRSISGKGAATKLVEKKYSISGMAFGGLPIRLAVGFFTIPELSIEVSGRFDAWVSSEKSLKSCYELQLEQGGKYSDLNCKPSINESDPAADEKAKQSVAIDENNNTLMKSSTQIAWLVNARVRYALVSGDALRISAFVGIGYGFIKYRIATNGGDPYFPMPGMVDIEVGPSILYYFTPNVGIGAEVPIDFIVGDGFGFNFDPSLVLSFGY